MVGKDGRLYAARGATTGDFSTGAIFELDRTTGAIVRTVLANVTCPTGLIVDPVSGDLFFSDSCFGAGSDNPSLWRVANPASASPTLSVYATLPGTPTGWIAIAGDGTIYMPQTITGATPAPVLAISGTSQPQPATVTPLTGVNTNYWVTIAESLPGGAAKSLIVLDGPSGTVKLVDITATPPTYTDLIVGQPGSGVIGPDGCVYFSGLDMIYRLSTTAGDCSFKTGSAGPTLSISPAKVAPNPVQGALQTFTASFGNVAVPAGTPVTFLVGGANAALNLATTDANGVASITYRGYVAGTDSVVASATLGALPLASPPASVTFGAGPHPTVLTSTCPRARARRVCRPR